MNQNLLEPETSRIFDNSSEPGEQALISIAISLKRIADAMAGDEKHSGITHAIHDIAEKTNRG